MSALCTSDTDATTNANIAKTLNSLSSIRQIVITAQQLSLKSNIIYLYKCDIAIELLWMFFFLIIIITTWHCCYFKSYTFPAALLLCYLMSLLLLELTVRALVLRLLLLREQRFALLVLCCIRRPPVIPLERVLSLSQRMLNEEGLQKLVHRLLFVLSSYN